MSNPNQDSLLKSYASGLASEVDRTGNAVRDTLAFLERARQDADSKYQEELKRAEEGRRPTTKQNEIDLENALMLTRRVQWPVNAEYQVAISTGFHLGVLTALHDLYKAFPELRSTDEENK
jgi:hypothetical protein